MLLRVGQSLTAMIEEREPKGEPEPEPASVLPLNDPEPSEPADQEPPSSEPEQKFLAEVQDRFCDS